MIRNNKYKMILTSIIILLPLAAGLLIWNRLPDQIPTHWGMNGEVNRWSSKAFAVLAIPLFILAVHWLCIVITSIDPKNKNITNKPLQLVLWICPVMSILVCSLIYASALGNEVNIDTIMPVFLGLMFVIIGNYLPKCQHNYTVGIKIPWTLHSEANWNATHRFAGPVWIVGGFLLMLSALFNVPWVYLVIILLIAVIPMVYSYLYYKKNS